MRNGPAIEFREAVVRMINAQPEFAYSRIKGNEWSMKSFADIFEVNDIQYSMGIFPKRRLRTRGLLSLVLTPCFRQGQRTRYTCHCVFKAPNTLLLRSLTL